METQDDFSYVDDRRFNHLMLAAEQGNVSALKRFLAIGMDVNSTVNHKTAASLAFSNKKYEALALLLQHNSLFPPDFKPELTSNFDLQIFTLTMEKFHEHLKLNQLNEITRLARENPQLRHFYSTHNVSAPAAALSAKDLDLYEFLITLNITIGPFEMLENAIDSLNEQEKLQLRAIHERHAKCLPEKHLMILEASSYVGHDEHDFDNKMAMVREAFADLNSMELIRPLLMLIAAARCFKIVFDFNSDSVQRMDPTSGRNDAGVFYITRHIFIGAKGLLVLATRAKVLGIMAHELCHYAMIIVFDNDCRPYRNVEKMTVGVEFNKIKNECHRNRGYVAIVRRVFDEYSANERHAELIVRAPQMIANYSNDEKKFTEVHDTYEDLFNFYEHKVLPEVKRATENTQKLAEEAIQSFAHGLRRKISKWKKISIGAAFALPFAMLLVYFLVHTRSFTCESLTDDERFEMNGSTIEYFGTNVTYGEFFNKENGNSCGNLTSESIEKLISTNFLNYTEIEETKTEDFVDFTWINLAPNFKAKILNSLINFQGSEMQFFNLLGINAEDCEDLIHDRLEGDATSSKTLKSSTSNHDYIINVNLAIPPPPKDNKRILMKDFQGFFSRTNLDDSAPSIEKSKQIESFNFTLTYNFTRSEVKIIAKKTLQNMHLTQSHKILQTNHLKIGEKPEILSQFYYPRNFIKPALFITHTFDEVQRSSNVILLADVAGSGKTTTFKHISWNLKQIFPSAWIFNVDLKDHLDIYQTMKNENLFKLEDFLVKLLKLNVFDAFLLGNYLRINKMILMWDGVDEISPIYKDFIMNVMLHVRKLGNIQQWISTRTELRHDLESRLDCIAYQLSNFESADFLQKYLSYVYDKNQTKKEDNDAKNSMKDIVIGSQLNETLRIIEKIEHFPWTNTSLDINNPLLLVMLANMTIFNNQDKTCNVNVKSLYSIYSSMTCQMFRHFRDKKEVVSNDDDLMRSQTAMSFQSLHQMLAIRDLTYNAPYELNIMYQKIDESMITTINRYGIVYIKTLYDFSFVHRLFAEYFLARYLYENLMNTQDINIDKRELNERLKLLKESFKISSKVSYFLDIVIEDSPKVLSKTIRCAVRNFSSYKKDSIESTELDFVRHFSRAFRYDTLLILELWRIKSSLTDYCDSKNSKEIFVPTINDQNFNEFFLNQKGQVFFTAWKFNLKLEKNFSNFLKFKLVEASKRMSLNDFFNFLLDTTNLGEIREIVNQNGHLIFKEGKAKNSNQTDQWLAIVSSLDENNLKFLLLKIIEIYVEFSSQRSFSQRSSDWPGKENVTDITKELNTKGLDKAMIHQIICPQVSVIKKRLEERLMENVSDVNVGQNFVNFKELAYYDQTQESPSLLFDAFESRFSSGFIKETLDIFILNSNAFEQKLCLASRNPANDTLLNLSIKRSDVTLIKYLTENLIRLFSRSELVSLLIFERQFDKLHIADLSYSSFNATKEYLSFLVDQVFENRTSDLVALLSERTEDGQTVFDQMFKSPYSPRMPERMRNVDLMFEVLKPHVSDTERVQYSKNLDYLDAITDLKANFSVSENVINFLTKFSDILESDQIYQLKDTLVENSQDLSSAYSVFEKYLETITAEQTENTNCSVAEVFEDCQNFLTKETLIQGLISKFDHVFQKYQCCELLETNLKEQKNYLLYSHKINSFGSFFVARFFIEYIYKANEVTNQSEFQVQKAIDLLFFSNWNTEYTQKIIFIIKNFLETQGNIKPVLKIVTDKITQSHKNVIKKLSIKYNENLEIFQYDHNFHILDNKRTQKLFEILRIIFAKNVEILKFLFDNEEGNVFDNEGYL
jgi:hypothetical protein